MRKLKQKIQKIQQNIRILYIRKIDFISWHLYYKHTKAWKKEIKDHSEKMYRIRKELIGK